MNGIQNKMITEADQGTQLSNIKEQNFKLELSAVIQTALESKEQLSELDLARLSGFTEDECNMLIIYWKPCFNNSWIYLSDELILENLTNETKKDAIRHFYERILISNYEDGIDYQQVLVDNELVKFWWASSPVLATDKPRSRPAHNKKYYLVTGEAYKCMLMASRAEKGKQTRKYYIKVESLARTMKDYIFEYTNREKELQFQLQQLQIQLQQKHYKLLEQKFNSSLQKHRYFKFKDTGPGLYIIHSGLDYFDGVNRVKVGIAGVPRRKPIHGNCDTCKNCSTCNPEQDRKVVVESIDKRLQNHRTLWPRLRVNFLLFTHDVTLLEKCLKRIYKENINPGGHEIVEGVSKETLIQKTKELLIMLNIDYEDYRICSDEELNNYNQIVLSTIKVEQSKEEFPEETHEKEEVEEEDKEVEEKEGDDEEGEKYEGEERDDEEGEKYEDEEGDEEEEKRREILDNLENYKDKELRELLKLFDIPSTNLLKEDKKRVLRKFLTDKKGEFLRECKECKENKQLIVDNYRKFGPKSWFSSTCKDCEFKLNAPGPIVYKKDIRSKIDLKVGTKRCSKCKEELSKNDFYKNKSFSDGYCHTCKNCDTLRKSGGKIVKAIKIVPNNVPKESKWCPKCEIILNKSCFRTANRPDGLEYSCRQCYNKARSKSRKLKSLES
jgi:hypothetical protein